MRGAIRDHWQDLVRFLRTPTLSRSVIGLLTAAVLLLLAINAATFVMIRRTAEFNEMSFQTQLVRRATRTVVITVLNAETNQRAFLLTGQPAYYSAYLQARNSVDANIAAARALASGNEDVRPHLDEVERLATDKVSEMDRSIAQMRSGRVADAMQLVRSGEGLMVILNDILDISKIEAGKLELETIAFDLHDLGQQVQALWSEAARTKGVTLAYDFALETPRWVLGDPTRLRQIMNNLIGNALKFTDRGEVRLSIRRGGGDVCEIAVSDTGLGISEAEQARLFQAFQQVDASTARKFGGTGLGLAICRQLATLMGGEIGLSSREGEGSVFTLRAPLLPAQPIQADAPEASNFSLAGLRILVADDNPVNLAVARAILEAFGASLVTAENGADALDKLGCESVDIVLLDVHMPITDGYEALAKIRAGGTRLRKLPVIALTADAMAGANADLLAAGFDGVAPKPINPQQLVGMVAAASAQSTDDTRGHSAVAPGAR